MKTKQEPIYMTFEQSIDLVERIAERCKQFDYKMQDAEMRSMANLLCEVGVSVDDLLDVSNLADNYAINAEIVHGDEEAEQYSRVSLQDALFTWLNRSGETCYCINW